MAKSHSTHVALVFSVVLPIFHFVLEATPPGESITPITEIEALIVIRVHLISPTGTIAIIGPITTSIGMVNKVEMTLMINIVGIEIETIIKISHETHRIRGTNNTLTNVPQPQRIIRS